MSYYTKEYVEKEHPDLYKANYFCSTSHICEVDLIKERPKWYLMGALPEGVDEKYLRKSPYKWISEKARVRVLLKRIKNIEAARKREEYYVMHYKYVKLQKLYAKMFGDTPVSCYFKSALFDIQGLSERRSWQNHDFTGRQLSYLASEIKREHLNKYLY